MPASINVPPAKGKTAAQAARELRVLLKQLYSETLTATPPAPLPSKNNDPLRGLGKIDEMVASIEIYLGQFESDLADLVEISKKRRPSEIRKKVEEIRSNSLGSIKNNIWYLQDWSKWTKARVSTTPAQVAAPANKQQLEQAYSLIQAIPVVDNPPNGKEQSTLRAIKAILKVHDGVDPLTTFDSIEMPEIPIVLLHEPRATNGQSKFVGPFRILADFMQATSSGYDQRTLQAGWANGVIYGSIKDGPGEISGWNNGDCTLEHAKDAFRAFCNGYRIAVFIVDANNKRIAERMIAGKAIKWFNS